MTHVPYVRLRPEDLRGSSAIWGWTTAPATTVAALGLPPARRIAVPLAGTRRKDGSHSRRQMREGFAALFALAPSHPDRTLYLEMLASADPGFEIWLEGRVARAFSRERYERALREAVALVNLAPGRAETRFNLGLLLSRIVNRDPDGPNARRWAMLARGEFARAAELAPELFWGHYHRGVLAYDAGLPDAARQDWQRLLDRYFADKPAPRSFDLKELLPLDDSEESAELPGLVYTVLLDYLGLVLPARATQEPRQEAQIPT